MGLFVVGRLSLRHGIRIQLRPSDSGGTTALVMLPVDVAQGGKKPTPGKPGQGAPAAGGPAAAQAAAGAAAARRRPAAGRVRRRRPLRAAVAGAAPQRGQVGAGQGPRAALPGDRGPGGPGDPVAAWAAGRSAGAPAGRPASGRCRCRVGGGAFGGQAPGAPQGLQAAGPVARAASRASTTPDARAASERRPASPAGGPAAPARQPADRGGPVPCAQQGTDVPAGAGRSCPAAAVRVPSCPAAAPQSRDAELERRQRAAAGAACLAGRPARPRRAAGRTAPMPRVDTARLRARPRSSGIPRGRLRQPAPRRERAAAARTNAPTCRGPVLRRRPPVRPGRPAGPSSPASLDAGLDGSGRLPAPAGRTRRTPASSAPATSPQATGQFGAAGSTTSGTGQFPLGRQAPAPASRAAAGQRRRASPRPGRRCRRSASAAAPQPAGAGGAAAGDRSGDGRTPLYDTLETNWFHGQGGGQNGQQQGNGSAPQQSGRPAPPQPQAPAAPQRPATPAAPAARHLAQPRPTTSWCARPSASGSPRPAASPPPACRAGSRARTSCRAPLSSRQHQTGPQVSRAPDDVRGRLTNLRRGIQQGRQAGNGRRPAASPRAPLTSRSVS